MSHFDDDEPPGFFARHRWLLGLIAVLGIGGAVWGANALSKKKPAAPRMESITFVSLPPPPPPPPPPPKVEPPPPEPEQEEEKMIEQEPVAEDEEKPEEQPPNSSPPPSTGIVGNGPPDGFGLSAGGGGRGTVGGRGSGRSGSKWGWYAGQVQSSISDALKRNNSTRSARMSLQVKIWPDSSGRVQRAQLVGSTGDGALDRAIRDEVLTGLQLREPPPADMPMPINLRLNARKPN